MLDTVVGAVAHKLDTYKKAVLAQRVTIERERAGDTARQHAGREFENSEGFTTSLPRAAQNAQNEYARLRRDFLQHGGVEALSSAIALLVARERRDEAGAALKRHEEAENERRATGVHREVKAGFALMFAQGVEPRHVAEVRPAMMAIISDLLRWDGQDPEWADPDSPVPAVFEIYASRVLMVPSKTSDKKRSYCGIAPAQVRATDPLYWDFSRRPPIGAPFEPNDADARVSVEPLDPVAPLEQVTPIIVVTEPPEQDVFAVAPSVPKAAVANEQPEPVPALGPLSRARAQEMAEFIADNHPQRIPRFWPPEGVERGDYDSDMLVPALKRWCHSQRTISGEAFLGAAYNGQAREFIENQRRVMVQRLTDGLLAGEDRALEEARFVGLPV